MVLLKGKHPANNGITSLKQNLNLKLAKVLKEKDPELTIALGGYAVQHENGLEVINAFPWVDCIARGDGEPVIADLARASVGMGNVSSIAGVLTRFNSDTQFSNTPPHWDIRSSKTPNFDDWFLDLERVENEHNITIKSPYLVMESSRGCWWGQKNHCTFCGIDDETLKYRAKTAEQVLSEIRELRKKYGKNMAIRFADYILPSNFHTELLPLLAKLKPKQELEAEI